MKPQPLTATAAITTFILVNQPTFPATLEQAKSHGGEPTANMVKALKGLSFYKSHTHTHRIKTTDHVVLVLNKDAEFLEKRDDKNQQLDIFSVEGPYKQLGNALVTHLQFHFEVLRQIQQQVI